MERYLLKFRVIDLDIFDLIVKRKVRVYLIKLFLFYCRNVFYSFMSLYSFFLVGGDIWEGCGKF